jgi:hypothetical protein
MEYIANPVRVEAFVITSVMAGTVGPRSERGGVVITLEDGRKEFCDAGMIARYSPVEGDYLVIQEDGYKYLNPKEVFERKYRLSEDKGGPHAAHD